MIRSENAQRTAWVFVDFEGRDLGGYIEEARRVVAEAVPMPPGYSLRFSGQFEIWEKTLPRLVAASAFTLVLIVVLLYASSRSWLRVGIVMMAVPFSLVGAPAISMPCGLGPNGLPLGLQFVDANQGGFAQQGARALHQGVNMRFLVPWRHYMTFFIADFILGQIRKDVLR